jgi:acetyltransferase-like isoleucine patch superfamily enzyme
MLPIHAILVFGFALRYVCLLARGIFPLVNRNRRSVPVDRPHGIHATARIHPTALIEHEVVIGAKTAVWDNVHIRHAARIGEECIIGEKTYIAYGVNIGHRVKINALVYICAGVTIEDGVMISAGSIFTNDRFPRATAPNLRQLRSSEPDENTSPTLVKQGATLGAGCVIGNPLVIGRFAMVGMGALVTRSVPDYHLVIGHPAKSIGAVCRCGQVLVRAGRDAGTISRKVKCRACGLQYVIAGGIVTELGPPG